MKLQAAKGWVVLKDAGPQKTKSGLDMTTTNEKNKPALGIVISVGDGKLPIAFETGDKIVFEQYSPSKTNIGTEAFMFVPFKSICAVVVEGEDG